MSKTLLYNNKNKENKQFKISEVLAEEQQQEEEEFIILKIYKSEIDKAIKDLKEHKKINQYYQPDYKLIVERYKDTILDDYGWYERLKKTIVSIDKTLDVYDEL
jgi:predicted transcriptional regulator